MSYNQLSKDNHYLTNLEPYNKRKKSDEYQFDFSSITSSEAPSSGKPGKTIIIFTNNHMYSQLSHKKKVSNLVHAIGHAVGFSHYNDHINGNNASIPDIAIGNYDWFMMWGHQSTFEWGNNNAKFSDKDITAIRKVYGTSNIKPGSIPSAKLMDVESGIFSILSQTDASGGENAIKYVWEEMINNYWEPITKQTTKDLVDMIVPVKLTSIYRRKANDGYTSVYSNECTVTNNVYLPHLGGKIQSSLTIEMDNPADILNISSVESAFCPRGSKTYTYRWEINDGTVWTVIPNATDASLQTTAPMKLDSKYRRKATCEHEYKYSNECTVYNRSFIDAGTITELVELYKTGFDLYFDIPSQSESSLTAAKYTWEINKGGGWINWVNWAALDNGKSLRRQFLPDQRIARFRRVVSTPFGLAYSNECTVINYALREDPRQGTDFNNPIKLGICNSGLHETLVIDTRGEYFQDRNKIPGCGNEAYVEFELTDSMYVEIKTGSFTMHVWMDVWEKTTTWHKYEGMSSKALGSWRGYKLEGYHIPFSDFDINYDGEFEPVILDLEAGKYIIQLQGGKVGNAPGYNGIFSICLNLIEQ